MADQQYLDLLFRRAGAETFEQVVHLWNQWREQHPDVHIDLSDADMSGGDYTGIDLSHVDLRRASLYDPTLRRKFFEDFYAQFARGYDIAELGFFDYLIRSHRLENLSGYWNFVDFRLAVGQLMAAFDVLTHHAAQNTVVSNWLAFLAHPGNESWWVAHNGGINAGDSAARATGVYGRESTVEQLYINDAIHIIKDIQFVSQVNLLGSWLGPQSSVTGFLNQHLEP